MSGWSNQTVDLIILSESAGGFSGQFGYSPSPGPGNLVQSDTEAGGTDPYGNQYLPGAVSYQLVSGTYYAVQQWENQIAFLSSSPNMGPWTLDAQVLRRLTGALPLLEMNVTGGPLIRVNSNTAAVELAGGNAGGVQILNTVLPNAPALGAALYSPGGTFKWVGTDGNAYNTGRLSLAITGNQTINSTALTPITGLSGIPVNAGTHRVHGQILWNNVTAAVAQKFGWQGANITSGTRIVYTFVEASSGGTVNYGDIFSSTTVSSPAYGTGTHAYFIFDGVIVFSAADTFGLMGAEGTSGDTWTVLAGSFLDLMPIA